MTKYLTEQVENGNPYSDIFEVHNRVIAGGKAIKFFYHFIKDYTIQLSNLYNIDIDWTGIPDNVTFDYDYIQEGDTVEYLNDLVNSINSAKDMLAKANGQYTAFFKKFLDTVDTDNDAISSLVLGDTDIHNKPTLNYNHLYLSWEVGDVVYADDFNAIKSAELELLNAMNKIFGAYYNLIEREGLDLKTSEFSNYNVQVTDSSLTFSNKISDWTKVEPYAPESGATIFYQYDDDYKWNYRVIVWKSEDESSHRFTIWNYFEQKYVFDSGWYPAQSFPTDFDMPTWFNNWKDGPWTVSSVYISTDYTKVTYGSIRTGACTTNLGGDDDDGRIVTAVQTIINLNTGEVTTYKHYIASTDDYYSSMSTFIDTFRGIHVLGTTYAYEKRNSSGYDRDYWELEYIDPDNGLRSNLMAHESGDSASMRWNNYTTNHISHLGSRSFLVWMETEDENDERGSWLKCYLSGPTTFTSSRAPNAYDSSVGGSIGEKKIWVAGAIVNARESHDDDYEVGMTSTLGSSIVSKSCGEDEGSYVYSGYKLRYGIPYGWAEYSCNYPDYYWGMVARLDRPAKAERGYTQNKDGNHPVQWTAIGFDKHDEYIGLYWEYPEIKWLVAYKKYYDIQNPRVFEDSTTIDSTGVAYFVTGKYFVPETWYGVPVIDTEDGFAREDGTLPIRFNYWGLDSDKLSTYDTLIIKIL